MEFQFVARFEDAEEAEDAAERDDDEDGDEEPFASSSALTWLSFGAASGSFFDPEDHSVHQPMPVFKGLTVGGPGNVSPPQKKAGVSVMYGLGGPIHIPRAKLPT
jgi:hypothetical protein